jgi:hypothetical protein
MTLLGPSHMVQSKKRGIALNDGCFTVSTIN